MNAKSEALARQFEAKAWEALATLEQLSDADWTKVTEAEYEGRDDRAAQAGHGHGGRDHPENDRPLSPTSPSRSAGSRYREDIDTR